MNSENKKALYESIMAKVAKEVKKAINEVSDDLLNRAADAAYAKASDYDQASDDRMARYYERRGRRIEDYRDTDARTQRMRERVAQRAAQTEEFDKIAAGELQGDFSRYIDTNACEYEVESQLMLIGLNMYGMKCLSKWLPAARISVAEFQIELDKNEVTVFYDTYEADSGEEFVVKYEQGDSLVDVLNRACEEIDMLS